MWLGAYKCGLVPINLCTVHITRRGGKGQTCYTAVMHVHACLSLHGTRLQSFIRPDKWTLENQLYALTQRMTNQVFIAKQHYEGRVLVSPTNTACESHDGQCRGG
jgi:hypothetical protein